MNSTMIQKNIKLKRAYEQPTRGDGVRILVDRLWPRGVRKTDAAIDHWMRDVAPSASLRQWFGHDPVRWVEFRRRYRKELKEHEKEIGELRGLTRHGPITLVYAARDQAYNEAVVLRDFLIGQ